jgi:hypothetical protein
MTVVVLKTGKTAVLDAHIAALLWRIKNREVKDASPELKAKASKISRFLFGPETAPDSWKRKNQSARATVETQPGEQKLPWFHY